MFELGRVCIKLKGSDAGKKCVIIDHIDARHVFVDGFTRRKKCNIWHLEQTDSIVKIEKGASHDAVMAALESELMNST